MTTPGAVGDQAAMPSRAGVGRLREMGAKSDAAAATGEAEDGFGNVLTKLQKDDGQPVGEFSAPSGSAKTGARIGSRQNEGDAARVSEDGTGDLRPTAPTKYLGYGDLGLGDGQLEFAGEEAQSDDVPGSPLDSDASGVSDIAAIVGLAPLDPSAGSAPDAPEQSMMAVETRPAAKAKVVPDQMSAGGEIAPTATGGTARGASDAVGAGRSATAEADFNLTRSSNALGATEMDKIGRTDKGRKVTTESSSSSPSDDDMIALSADGDATSQPLKAGVLSQETHFAPVMRTSPELQTGDFAGDKGKPGLGSEAPGPQSAPSVTTVLPSGDGALSFAASPANQIADHVIAAAASADPTGQAGAVPGLAVMKPPIKVLSIQLQPADLGTITVRMELKDSELKLRVEADRADTADLIRGDQDTLSRLLRSAGYAVDPSAIRVVEGDRVAASQQAGQQGTQTNLQSSPQWQSGSSERQGHGQRGSTGTHDGETSPQTSRNDSNETTTNRGGRGLFV